MYSMAVHPGILELLPQGPHHLIRLGLHTSCFLILLTNKSSHIVNITMFLNMLFKIVLNLFRQDNKGSIFKLTIIVYC
jgi:hypothetical protein